MVHFLKGLRLFGISVLLAMFASLAAACGGDDPTPTPKPKPTPTTPPAPTIPAWQVEWDATVAAAEAEGEVVVIVPPSEARQASVELFREKYPKIKLEVEVGHIRNIGQSIAQEHDANIFQFDVCYGCVGTVVYNEWIPRDSIVNLREHLILPEVIDEDAWEGGWEHAFADTAGNRMFGFVANRGRPQLFVDRDVIPESELPAAISLAEIANPKWKGKLIWNDPSRPGAGSTVPAAMIINGMETELRSIFPDQDFLIGSSNQQTTEFLVRGTVPMAIGIDSRELAEFQKQGVGKSVVGVPFTEFLQESYGFGVLSMLKNAPHPNAAKVFANWWLTKEAQANHTKHTSDDSRRKDVERTRLSAEQLPGQKVVNIQREIFNPDRTKSQALIAELIK